MPDVKFYFRLTYTRRAGASQEKEIEVVEVWTAAAARAHAELTLRGLCDFPQIDRRRGWDLARCDRVGGYEYRQFRARRAQALKTKKGEHEQAET